MPPGALEALQVKGMRPKATLEVALPPRGLAFKEGRLARIAQSFLFENSEVGVCFLRETRWAFLFCGRCRADDVAPAGR